MSTKPTARPPPEEDWGWIHIDFFGGKSATMWVVRCEECDEILCPPYKAGGSWLHERSGLKACPDVEEEK